MGKKPFRLLESKKRKKYTQSLLNDEGKYVYGYLHRLVALAYIPNPNSYPIVRHLDDIGTHNTVNNLRWGTQKDNVNDSIINGKHSMPPYGSGLNSPRSLLSNNPRKQRRIHRLFSLGYTYKEIGRKVRLSPKVVSRFIRLRNSLD